MAGQSFFHRFLLPFVLLVLALQPAIAKSRDLSQYPLRIHIFQSQWTAGNYGFGQGAGIANLYDGPNIRGITFSYDCAIRYQESAGDQSYAAKWKKAERSLEIVGSKVGNAEQTDTCEFKITPHNFVYDVQNGTIVTFSPEQYRVRIGVALPSGGAMDTNPTHYPLRIAVLQASWEPSVNGMRKGSGRGNLLVGPRISSVDFTSGCNVPFGPTSEDRYYPAIWVHEGAELAILLTAQNGSALCTMEVNIHTDIYVRETGAVKAVSQEEYAKIHAK